MRFMISVPISPNLAELLTPESWGRSYFRVEAMNQELVGFFQFKPQGDVIDIGLVTPRLNRQGAWVAVCGGWIGLCAASLHAATISFGGAAFNHGARRVYERAGF